MLRLKNFSIIRGFDAIENLKLEFTAFKCDQEELVELFKTGDSLPNNILKCSNKINMEYNKYIN